LRIAFGLKDVKKGEDAFIDIYNCLVKLDTADPQEYIPFLAFFGVLFVM
jgi:hypothetical protein